MTDAGARLQSVKLITYAAYETGFKLGNTSYLRRRWDEEVGNLRAIFA